jgi:hypothetical protein
MLAIRKEILMKHDQSGSLPNAGKPEVDGSEQIAAHAASGPNVEQNGAPPTNRAPLSCKPIEKILRFGVDSLYLSFKGEMAKGVQKRLDALKLCAQSADPAEQAKAQLLIGPHAFMVHDRGARRFPYVISDPCFRIQLSSEKSKSLPMAYVKLSARYLSTVTPLEGLKALIAILETIGDIDQNPSVSRIDLFADFVSQVDMESWGRDAWVTRADAMGQYAEGNKFTGWCIGTGGPIMMRLYDKNLEIEKSGSQYVRTLWDAGGWKDGEPVWRLEFEFKKETLSKFGLDRFTSVMDQLNGLWTYAMDDWLRLCIPNPEDQTRSRWPVHPVWAALSSVDFGTPEMPRLSKVIVTRKPDHEAIIRRSISGLVSFMARESIVDLSEGLVRLNQCIEEQIASDAFWAGVDPVKYLVSKVALKRREYFMPASMEGDNDPFAADLDAETEAYRRASRGG